jgi:hypothetical protein
LPSVFPEIPAGTPKLAKFGRIARFSPDLPDLPDFPRFALFSPNSPKFWILPDFPRNPWLTHQICQILAENPICRNSRAAICVLFDNPIPPCIKIIRGGCVRLDGIDKETEE